MNPALWLALVACLPHSSSHDGPSLAEIRRAAAQAVGTIPSEGSWRMKGVAEYESLWQSFEMVGDGRYRYKKTVAGLLPLVEAFDGKTAWMDGKAGVPHVMARSARDLSRIVSYVADGAWPSPGAPLIFKLLEAGQDAISLDVRCSDGDTPATLSLDPKTYLPSRLTHWGSDGQDSWTFAGYTRESGWAVPTRVEHRGGDENELIAIETIQLEKSKEPSFREPKPTDEGVGYDRAAPKEIEVRRSMGYVFVHPKLNGRDEGWFFFDTGADVMVLDSHVAQKLGAQTIGSESTAGVVATSQMKICKGVRFQLGPIELQRPTYFEMDMAPFSAAFGVPVAGVCGYDCICRGAFDIDLGAKKIAVYAPGSAPLPAGAKWTPFTFESNVPCVACGFDPNHTGFFALDTGSGSAVDFCSPTVEKYELLKDRKVVSGVTGGAGGAVMSKAGKIDWFEFAGKRFDQPTVGFQLTKKGTFASPYFDGNIGEGLLRNGRLILDYRRSRLAFVPESPAPPRKAK